MPLARIDRHPFSLLDQAFNLLDNQHFTTPQRSEWVEKGDHYILSVDIPGVPIEDINVEVMDSTLKISGERKTLNEGGEGYARFERKFNLVPGIEQESIAAHYENGVLTLALPKHKKEQARKIDITGNSKEGVWGKLLGTGEEKKLS